MQLEILQPRAGNGAFNAQVIILHDYDKFMTIYHAFIIEVEVQTAIAHYLFICVGDKRESVYVRVFLFHNIDIFLKIMDAKENSKRKAKKIHRLVKWCFNIVK
jgi:hypothetical protein